MPLRLMLCDDHAVVRQGLKSLLEQKGFQVIGEAADGREAARLVKELSPDIAILDLSMPVLNGVDAAREIVRTNPKTKTILLTMHNEEQYVLDALRAGVQGYVLKTEAAADLLHAVQEVSKGFSYLSPKVSKAVVQAYLDKSEFAPDPLTPREREVLQLIAEGKSTKEAAAILGVSVKTAESHRTKIMEKLDTHGTAGLVRYAIRRGLIQP